jgi:hypothetical protein
MAIHGQRVWYFTGDESLKYESPDKSQVGELLGVAYLHELKHRATGRLMYKLWERDPKDEFCDTIWLKSATGRIVACPRTEHYKAQVDFANEAGASSPYFWPTAGEIETAKRELAVKAEIGRKTMEALAKKRKESSLVREMLSTSLSAEAVREINNE